MIDLLVGNENTDQPDDGQQHHQDAGTVAGITAPAGSLAAKKAWYQIQNDAYSPESVAKAKKRGFTEAKGLYAGKPLLRGIHEGQGDFDMIRDRLRIAQGLEPSAVEQVIAKIKAYRLANP